MTREATPLSLVFESVHQLQLDERQAWYALNGITLEQQNEVEQLLHHAEEADAESLFTPFSKSRSDVDDVIGEQIGPYQVKRLLGSGGMGSVYLAERMQPYFQQVAIKIADIQIRTGLERFQAERQLLAELQHPGVARILDGGVLADKRPYLVMEYVPGQHIDKYAEQHKLRVNERVKLWLQVCEAVAAAHERGIVHRDLKPSNILVTDKGRAVVVDFGLARRWEEESGLTKTSTILGTPEYMAPEQAGAPSPQAAFVNENQRPTITPAADVYALGAVLYLLLCGRPPFRADTTYLLINQLFDMDPLPLRRLNQAVSRDLETLCLHCLKKKPSERYQNANELCEEVQRLLDGQPIKARPTGLLKHVWSWAKRRPVPAVLSLLLVVTIITSLVAIGFYWRKAFYSLETAKQATVHLFDHAVQLSNEPGMQKSQVELLTKSIESYAKLVKLLNDEQITWQFMKARRVLFECSARLGIRDGEEQKAEVLLRDAEIFATEFPSTNSELELAYANMRMANIREIIIDQARAREIASAKPELTLRAIAILEQLCKRHPERHSLVGIHGEFLHRLSHMYMIRGSFSDALAQAERAKDIFKQLYDLYPSDPQACIRYSDSLVKQATLIQHQHDKDRQYGELLEQASKIDFMMAKKWPLIIDHRRRTCHCTFLYAHWLERKGEWLKALELYDDLAELGVKLLKQFPDVISNYLALSDVYFNQGCIFHAQGGITDASQSFKRCYALYESILKMSPTHQAEFAMFYSMKLLSCPMTELRNQPRVMELDQLHMRNMNKDSQWNFVQGQLHLGRNRLVEAHSFFTQAMSLRYWNEEITTYQLHLALTHTKLGEVTNAREYLDQTKGYFQRYPKDLLLMPLRVELEKSLGQLH